MTVLEGEVGLVMVEVAPALLKAATSNEALIRNLIAQIDPMVEFRRAVIVPRKDS